MDKETLSHYGWIVVLVLILAVLLALATPFGSFIADGFKAAYAGFGMVSDNALGIVSPGAETDEQHGDNIWFYQPYKGTIEGIPFEMVFHEDGGYDMYIYADSATGQVFPAGTCTYEEGKVIHNGSSEEIIVTDLGYTATINIDGNSVEMKLEKVTQHYLYYDAIYVPVTKSDDFEWNVALHTDGSITDKEYYEGVEDDLSCGAGSITYESERFKFTNEDELFAIYPDGTKIIYIGAVLELDCVHANTEIRNQTDEYTGDEYCTNCNTLLNKGSVIGFGGEAYAIFTESNRTLWFIRAIEEPQVGDMYNGAEITNVYSGIETDRYYSSGDIEEPEAPWNSPMYKNDTVAKKAEKVIFVDRVKPISLAGWFADFLNCGYYDLTNLDASIADSMNCMFYSAAINTSKLEVIGIEDLDMSNVKSFTSMFRYAGTNAQTIAIDFKNWKTSSATDMTAMFGDVFRNTENINIEISGWNFKNLNRMAYMFDGAGYNAKNVKISIKNPVNAPTNLTVIAGIFEDVGYGAEIVELDVSGIDTRNVTSLDRTFLQAGYSAHTFVVNGLENWNVGNVTYSGGTFQRAGYNATTQFNIKGVESWRPTKMKNVTWMFANAGYNANYTLNLRNWGLTPTHTTSFKLNVESKILTTFS